MRVKEFGKLSVNTQTDLLQSAYSGEYNNCLENEDKIFLDLKTIYNINKDRCNPLRSLIDEVDLLEYRYISGFCKNYDCIEYLRELLYKNGVLLAKIPCKDTAYRRYSLNKKPLDAVRVYVQVIREGVSYTPSVPFKGDASVYFVIKYVGKNNECLGYITYYISSENFSKKSDKFTLSKNGKLFLLSFRKDLKDSLRNGFVDKINVL